MKIQSLEIHNFRGIRNLKLSFNSQDSLVLIGINGSGKSSILDCIAILLSWFIKRLEKSSSSGKFFKDQDITNGELEIKSTIKMSLGSGKSVNWLLTGINKGEIKTVRSDFSQLNKLITEIKEKLEENSNYALPLFIYYPTNRAVLDIPLRIKTSHSFKRLNAYDESLNGVDFRLFFEWFREREDLENELRLNNVSHRDYQLEAVRQAITKMMEGFTNLRVKRLPLRMVLEKRGQELIINQLSDGEKCLLAMVGDIARRLAILNNSEYPLENQGIILIDEIELHLHPGWQRKIIPTLRRTFPNCQFIVTTHSPQIISHVDSVYLLEETSEGVTAVVLDSYGKDSNYILESLMGTDERPSEVKDKISKIFRLIEQNNLDEAEEILQQLGGEIGLDDPSLLKADVLIKRKRIIGK